MRSFVKIKPSRNGEITLSFTDIGKSYLSCENHALVVNFNVANMSFNAIRVYKIIAKIFEFTVVCGDAWLLRLLIICAFLVTVLALGWGGVSLTFSHFTTFNIV